MKTDNYVDHFASVTEQVEDGTINPLDAYIQLRNIKSALEDALKAIEEAAISEAKSYGGEEIVRHGSIVRVVEGTPRYSYKNVPQWNHIKGRLSKIEELSKIASKGMTGYIVDENGEEIPAAEVSYSRTHIQLRQAALI